MGYYYMDMAKRLAEESSCVFGSMAAVVTVCKPPLDDWTPLCCAALSCHHKCTREECSCTMEDGVLTLLADVAAKVGHIKTEDPKAIFLYCADSKKKPRLAKLNEACWVVLRAAGIGSVFGCEQGNSEPVWISSCDRGRCSGSGWAELSGDVANCDIARAAKLTGQEPNALMTVLWPILPRLSKEPNPLENNFRAMVTRRDFLQNAEGQGYALSKEESEELDLLERLCFLERSPYVMCENGEQLFPELYRKDKLRAILDKYGLSCICGPGSQGKTVTVFYFATDGKQYMEWINHRDRLRTEMEHLYVKLCAKEKGSPRYDIIRQLLDSDKGRFTITECTDKESTDALDDICSAYEYRYAVNGKPGQVDICTLEALYYPNYRFRR